MERDSITAAPQVADTDALYRRWSEGHTGTKEDFFRFMTVPSAERSVFLSSQPCETEVTSRMLTATY